MMDKFTNVVYDPNQKEIARVNRKDGTLFLKPQIWDNLPEQEKEFVLLHEQGHLVMQTKDEYKCNQYAVKKFMPTHTLDNPELKKRITIMQDILTPGKENGGQAIKNDDVSPFVNAIAGAVGGIFQSLPLLGIGSAARQKETAAAADAQIKVIEAQAEADKKKQSNYLIYGIVGVVVLIFGIVLFFTLKKQ